jgi:hypothetical protein
LTLACADQVQKTCSFERGTIWSSGRSNMETSLGEKNY